MIPVTKSFFPPQSEFEGYLTKIWQSGWFTNSGSLVPELECKLEKYLGVKNLIFLNNGTIALQIALKALGISKEVITTPYSYVATTNAILWENCKPIFVDIDPKTFSIDSKKIEASITTETEAILATHCYGIPCETEKIKEIAEKYNLKIIYDAAHAFKVENNGSSILSEGNISTLSFHATKLFHTIEGGAIICNNDELAEEIKHKRSFGHNGDDYFGLGINGKNSEIHAAMGHVMLNHIDKIINKRKEIVFHYNKELEQANQFNTSILFNEFAFNYAYFPFVAESEEDLLALIFKFNEHNIYPRRYFYPSLNKLPHNQGADCPISEDISRKVICLPLYYELNKKTQDLIIEVIKNHYS